MRRTYYTSLVFGFFLSATALVHGQTPATTPPDGQAPAAATAPATPAPVDPGPLHQWGTDFTFLFDGYADANFNDPTPAFNGLAAFDVRANTAHVEMAEMTIDHAPAPVGFHLDIGFGEMFDIIHAGNRDPNAWKYFKQAYISFKPKWLGGVEIDAGEFVTSAGAEVIEPNQNFNYSRSLLFNWAIPYIHTGFRAQYGIGKHFTGTVQVVNGWNNVEPINSGKTLGFTGAYAWKKVTWNNNYYVGPEHPGTTKGWRNLYDTSIAVTQNDNLTWYLNFDYGRDKSIGPGASTWAGFAGAGRYAIGKKAAVALRAEYYDDADGFTTGLAQDVEEVTLTGEYKLTDWLMTRGEFRNDWSNKPFFVDGNKGDLSKTQPTVLLAVIAYFAPKK